MGVRETAMMPEQSRGCARLERRPALVDRALSEPADRKNAISQYEIVACCAAAYFLDMRK
jgi:hypothetical protein